MDNVINAFKGTITAVISSLLIAILFAYLFRFPIPMGGYIGPFGQFSSYDSNVIDTIKSILVAWAFYGVFGGFIILSLFGAIIGILIGKKYSHLVIKNKMILYSSSSISIVAIFILSILDYIIGSW